MTNPRWTAVDAYVEEVLVPSDAALDAALDANAAAGLPAHDVSPAQGKLLQLLAQVQGARTILEIGTLGGYSTIWLARALPPDGSLVTLEIDPHRAAVARTNVARAGLAASVEVRVGRALDVLPRLLDEGRAPFDLIFIDADKPSNPDYVAWALRLARTGTIILVDNVVRDGAILDAASDDASVQGVRRMNDLIAATESLSATIVQTVGRKGHDGFLLARVVDPKR
jgi:predicted O-methyltransferase YrrM